MKGSNCDRFLTSGRLAGRLLAANALALLVSCATPSERFIDDAESRGMTAAAVSVSSLRLVTFRNSLPGTAETLHVYLDGDGTPWKSRRRVASDPTTRERLVLELMARDPAPSVLVGRPCYYDPDQDCDASLWTSRRYGEEVVSAVAEAIELEIERAAPSSVTIIGYSGGGALAMLVAPRLSRVDSLVTLAANLDTDAWAAHHGYAPLKGSLNPASAPPLSQRISQLHVFGEKDRNVPAGIVRHVADRQPRSAVRIVPGFDHACCWDQAWPELLNGSSASPRAGPGDPAPR